MEVVQSSRWRQLVGVNKILALPSGPSSWLFAASMAFAPLVSLRVPGFSHFSYCDLLFVVAVLVGVVERAVCRDFFYEKLAFFAVLVYIYCVLSLSLSYVINYSDPVAIYSKHALSLGYTKNFFSLTLQTVLVPLGVFAILMRSLPELRFVILVWTLTVVLHSLFVIAYCKGLISHYDWHWAYIGRAAGYMFSPNQQGVYSVMALPGLMLFWCYSRSWLVRVFIIFGVMAVLTAANYSGSRTALGAALVAVLVFLVVLSRSRIRALLTGAAVFTVALLVREIIAAFPGALSPDSALGRLILGASGSNIIRDSLNTIAYNQWLDNPVFGVGYGMLRFAHNLYLQMLDVAGIVGTLGYLAALGMPLLFLLLKRTTEFARIEAAFFFSVLMIILAKAWVQPNIADYNTTVVFGMALYLVLNPRFYGVKS